MYIILSIIIILICFLIFNIIYKNISIKKVLNKINSRLSKKYNNIVISKINKNIYEFSNNEQKYLFFIENIPSNTTIQINNSTTWELKLSNSSSTGAKHSDSKILGSIIKFMNIKAEAKKIIIFTPDPKKIVMYINECEIIIVSSKTNVYGANIISINDIEKLK